MIGGLNFIMIQNQKLESGLLTSSDPTEGGAEFLTEPSKFDGGFGQQSNE